MTKKAEFFGLTVKDILSYVILAGSLLYTSSRNADSTADQLKLAVALLEVKLAAIEKNFAEKLDEVSAGVKALQPQLIKLQEEVSAVREDVGVLQEALKYKQDKK